VTQNAPAAFFSYSREDSEFALRLAEDLKEAGANVWLDQLDILGGQLWDVAVQDALANCPRMLLIPSPASVVNRNVLDEVSFALDEKKTVIPVFYKDCTIPFRLRRVQHVDFRQDYARGLKELLRTLNPGQSAEAISDAPRQYQTDTIGADKGERAAEEEPEKAEAQRAREAAEARERAEAERKAREQAEEARRTAEAQKAREEAEARQRAEARRKARKEKAEQERRRAEAQEALEKEEVAHPVAADSPRLVEEQPLAVEQPTDQALHKIGLIRRIFLGIGGLLILLVGWELWRVSNDKSWGVFFTMIFLFGLTGCWLLWEAIRGKK